MKEQEIKKLVTKSKYFKTLREYITPKKGLLPPVVQLGYETLLLEFFDCLEEATKDLGVMMISDQNQFMELRNNKKYKIIRKMPEHSVDILYTGVMELIDEVTKRLSECDQN